MGIEVRTAITSDKLLRGDLLDLLPPQHWSVIDGDLLRYLRQPSFRRQFLPLSTVAVTPPLIVYGRNELIFALKPATQAIDAFPEFSGAGFSPGSVEWKILNTVAVVRLLLDRAGPQIRAVNILLPSERQQRCDRVVQKKLISVGVPCVPSGSYRACEVHALRLEDAIAVLQARLPLRQARFVTITDVATLDALRGLGETVALWLLNQDKILKCGQSLTAFANCVRGASGLEEIGKCLDAARQTITDAESGFDLDLDPEDWAEIFENAGGDPNKIDDVLSSLDDLCGTLEGDDVGTLASLLSRLQKAAGLDGTVPIGDNRVPVEALLLAVSQGKLAFRCAGRPCPSGTSKAAQGELSVLGKKLAIDVCLSAEGAADLGLVPPDSAQGALFRLKQSVEEKPGAWLLVGGLVLLGVVALTSK